MFSKAEIFNLALSALLLQRQIINVDTDTSNQNKVLKQFFDIALRSALEDMNLTGTSSQVTLALVTKDPNELWDFAYQYPVECSFFRRIVTASVVDNRATYIRKRIAIHEGQKVIFTDEIDALAEYIPHTIDLNILSPSAGRVIGHRLAILSAPLIVGKGALKLKESLLLEYIRLKAEAQEMDHNENFDFNDIGVESEFVQARLE